MRCTVLIAALLVLVAACAARPESFVTRTPTPTGDAYTCALRMVNQLGFSVVNADREAGFINAERQTSGGAEVFLTGIKELDQLRISTYEDALSETTEIRVTAGQGTASAHAFSDVSETTMSAPSDSGREAARTILVACGEGPAAPMNREEVEEPPQVVPTETGVDTTAAQLGEVIEVPAELVSSLTPEGEVRVRARSMDPQVRVVADELTLEAPEATGASHGVRWLAGGWIIGLLSWGLLSSNLVP